ncbi:hypothetical protein KR222_005276 [Zaprionus bogoriensis]|nr:hypothetical protein KR222_005276 [Zaprionus bogoriensis]
MTTSLERELEEFFEDCRKQQFTEAQMRTICRPLIWEFIWQRLRRWTQWVLLPVLVVYLLWNYCDTCAWTASAIGRLLLIQLLPYWDWTPLYNNRCLIPRTPPAAEQREQPAPLGRHETLWENCALCENLESIPTASNVSFSQLEAEYLERGLPVIVTDCQLHMELHSLLQRIEQKTSGLLTDEPCDVSSNLMLRKLFNLELALQKISDTQRSSSLASWYLQFRNCVHKAVKASRLYAGRPYFYPVHLEPFYSSWLLMAHNQRRPLAEIYVRGLVFVQQLSGHYELQLRPKQPCDAELCPHLSLRLAAGECLVFPTDLWRFSYGLQKPETDSTSIASVLEVNWEL